MARIVWRGLDCWLPGGGGFRIVEHTNGWRVYWCGDPLDEVDYPSEEAAKAAAEAVVDQLTPPPLPPAREQRRARRPEEYPGRPPHPGTLRKPPKT